MSTNLIRDYISLGVIGLFLLTPYDFIYASNYTLPINEPGDSDIDYYAWFDHDISAAELYYDGDDGTSRIYDDHHGVDFSTNSVRVKKSTRQQTGLSAMMGGKIPLIIQKGMDTVFIFIIQTMGKERFMVTLPLLQIMWM